MSLSFIQILLLDKIKSIMIFTSTTYEKIVKNKIIDNDNLMKRIKSPKNEGWMEEIKS